MKYIKLPLIIFVMPLSVSAAITVQQPTTQQLTSASEAFQWETDTGSYCWDAQLNVSDTSGNTLHNSGVITPYNSGSGGTNVLYNMTGLPTDGTNLLVEMRCTPAETTIRSYASFDSSGGGNGGTNGNNGTSDVNVTVEVDATQIQTALAELFTDFDQALFAQILNGLFMSMALGLGGGWLYKAIRSR